MKKTRFVLTGGLGNQLFQYAAALSHGEDNEMAVQLEALLGKPRAANSTPDIFKFDLKNSVKHENWSSLANRALGYSLRTALLGDNSKLAKPSRIIQKSALSILVSVCLKSIMHVKSPSNLGFDGDFEIKPGGDLVIGYFQSYKYASFHHSTEKILHNLTLVGQEPTDLATLRLLAEKEHPLIVHIRRGDYRLEDSFGLLSPQYYKSILPEVYLEGKYQKIWLFSDDLSAAMDCIPDALRNEVRSIAEVGNSPAATLQAMRLGHGYVIANSSFSWWGAFLSNHSNVPVHAPEPWFKGMNSPQHLLPPQWVRHKSIWE